MTFPSRPRPSEAGWSDFETRFRRHLRALGIGDVPMRLLVAYSGGVDSTVLLYLLRFRCSDFPFVITAGHLDHRMRSSSEGDARWVAGLCRAWDIPLEVGTPGRALSGEASARGARYDFLSRAATRTGADRVITAHHADDQAETVLFRILRGTGLPGLAGIPRQTHSGIVRPLLPFWRAEIEAYAESVGLTWREDPSNAIHGPTRNRIRHAILPEIERQISHTARRRLVDLADLARESEAGWRRIVDAAYARVVTVESDSLLIARDRLAEFDREIRSRLVRKVLRRFGIVPNRAGTRSALTFITDAPSGRQLQLSGSVRISTEFDRARVCGLRPTTEDATLILRLPTPEGPSEGSFSVGGQHYRAEMRLVSSGVPADSTPARWTVRARLAAERFPLTLRARGAGDRIRTTGGTRSLKRLMIDTRVPVSERGRRPVVIDRHGQILAVCGMDLPPSDTPDGVFVEIVIRDD